MTLTNVERREGLTTIPGCHMAAGQALREALSKAAPVALEPVMRVEINVPEDFLGPAISLFTAAGGKVEDLGGPCRAQAAARHGPVAPSVRLLHLLALGHPGTGRIDAGL